MIVMNRGAFSFVPKMFILGKSNSIGVVVVVVVIVIIDACENSVGEWKSIQVFPLFGGEGNFNTHLRASNVI